MVNHSIPSLGMITSYIEENGNETLYENTRSDGNALPITRNNPASAVRQPSLFTVRASQLLSLMNRVTRLAPSPRAPAQRPTSVSGPSSGTSNTLPTTA